MLADQSNICPVERGHQWNIAVFFFKHLLGREGGIGIRNGVMRVQQIQFIQIGNAVNHGGKCNIIRLILEQRIGLHIHAVKEYIGIGNIQPRGQIAGDKMNFISFVRQRHAQFCGNNSAASIGRITQYSNFHTDDLFNV